MIELDDYMREMAHCKTGLDVIYLRERLYVLEEYQDSVFPKSGKLCTVQTAQSIYFEDVNVSLCALEVDIVYNGRVGRYGTYVAYIILDYTAFIRSRKSSDRIKRYWKRYQLRKSSVRVIERCYLNWQFRKQVIWNPRTILGIANLYLDYLRALKLI
jgi:hypothetical protein